MTYPDGGHQVGDIFELPKEQVLYYEKMGWVSPLPEEFQPKGKRGRKKVKTDSPTDLSKSPHVGRLLQHTFK